MGDGSPKLGVCFPRELDPRLIRDVAVRAEAGGVDELWVIEDCFYTAGISLAATALAVTERLVVGIGILPAVVRNPAITAMELGTLAGLAPGRVVGGIGHGVQEWMAQIGARQPSPVTALEETITAVRRLLTGDTVTTHGRFVQLDDVRLDRPPDPAPPVLAGVRGPVSLAAAGRCADGLVLAEMSGPVAIRGALHAAAPTGPFDVVTYSAMSIDPDRREARRAMAGLIAELVEQGGPPGLRANPFYDELAMLVQTSGAAAVDDFPDDWWIHLGAVGTPDDVAAHIAALGAAGATTVACFLAPEPDVALQQLDVLISSF
ncbi:MAG: LLM class flavin-dependent oxidoreductase [Ilumatobacteraceae bacterium]